MKVAINLGAPYAAALKDMQLLNQLTYVVEAEKLGVESAWSAEAWGTMPRLPWPFWRLGPAASIWAPASCRSARVRLPWSA